VGTPDLARCGFPLVIGQSSTGQGQRLLDTGAPVPSAEGRAALADVCNYGVAAYPHRFGIKPDGLCANYNLNSFGAREVSELTGSTTVGFQMLNTFKGKTSPQGGLLLGDALNRGIRLGAHFIEVYAVDCKDPRDAQVLTEAADKLKKLPSKLTLPARRGDRKQFLARKRPFWLVTSNSTDKAQPFLLTSSVIMKLACFRRG
jgi:hypothetical protein